MTLPRSAADVLAGHVLFELEAHPAPPPGGVAPAWVNVAVPPRTERQLRLPDVGDLANLVLRRCYERVEAGEAAVTIRYAIAALRLAWQIEHEDALAERDAARRQMEEWQHGLRIIRNAIVRQYGPARSP